MIWTVFASIATAWKTGTFSPRMAETEAGTLRTCSLNDEGLGEAEVGQVATTGE